MILEIFKEFEILLSDLIFSGAENIDSSFIEKINLICDKLDKLEINHVKKLTEDLIDSLKEFQKIKDIKKVSVNISKLEFYLSYALFYLSN